MGDKDLEQKAAEETEASGMGWSFNERASFALFPSVQITAWHRPHQRKPHGNLAIPASIPQTPPAVAPPDR